MDTEYRIIDGKYLVAIEWQSMPEEMPKEGDEIEHFAVVFDVQTISDNGKNIKCKKSKAYEIIRISEQLQMIEKETKKIVYTESQF